MYYVGICADPIQKLVVEHNLEHFSVKVFLTHAFRESVELKVEHLKQATLKTVWGYGLRFSSQHCAVLSLSKSTTVFLKLVLIQ